MLRLPTPDADFPLAAPAGKGSRAVSAALAALRSAIAQDPAARPTLGALAKAAGTSPRSLTRQFTRTLGTSPLAVGRQLRLAAARQTLATGQVASVLETALRHGFDHPGRFALAYARAFGEPPFATLRDARAAPWAPQAQHGIARIALRPFDTADGDEAAARRATDELAIAVTRCRDLALLDRSVCAAGGRPAAYRLQGRLEAGTVVLELVHVARGIVLWTSRESLMSRGRLAWADRSIESALAAITADRLAEARRVPRRLADADSLVTRARPAALALDRTADAMALDLLAEALHRDPAHAQAHALLAWCRGQRAQHIFSHEPEAERRLALCHAERAVALAPDDAEVLTHAAAALSLAGRLDDAERLAARALVFDPGRADAWRRLTWITVYRGDGAAAARDFARALRIWPDSRSQALGRHGLGVARFIAGDFARSARSLAAAMQLRPAMVWGNHFLVPAAMHTGATAEARRALIVLRRASPDLTVDLCARAKISWDLAAKDWLLDGLARAGLPRS
jgi:AraC-like DNA-binding protein/Flp pilus assembly protein TadD